MSLAAGTMALAGNFAAVVAAVMKVARTIAGVGLAIGAGVGASAASVVVGYPAHRIKSAPGSTGVASSAAAIRWTVEGRAGCP